MTTPHAVSREEVMACLDGELDPVRASHVREHMDACAECRAAAEEFRVLSTRLAAWQIDAPPARLATAPVERLHAQEPVRGSRFAWLTDRQFGLPRWTFAAVPALALLLLVVSTPTRQQRVLTIPEMVEGTPMPRSSGLADLAPSVGQFQKGERSTGETLQSFEPGAPMIARTATMNLVTDKFDEMRAALERLVANVGGTIGSLDISGDASRQRSIRAVLRVPANRLDSALADLRRLGRVRQEAMASEDIGDSHRDLVVRIANAKREEVRLNELLTRRTDRLSDVLEVEREVSRVRGDIERMESEELSMRTRVSFSTVTVHIEETYHAELALDQLPVSTRLRNAIVDGGREAAESLVSGLLVLLEVGPTLLAWITIFGLPAWWLTKRVRRSRTAGSRPAVR